MEVYGFSKFDQDLPGQQKQKAALMAGAGTWLSSAVPQPCPSYTCKYIAKAPYEVPTVWNRCVGHSATPQMLNSGLIPVQNLPFRKHLQVN